MAATANKDVKSTSKPTPKEKPIFFFEKYRMIRQGTYRLNDSEIKLVLEVPKAKSAKEFDLDISETIIKLNSEQ